jgi:YesN/AraC family two-component response regulator
MKCVIIDDEPLAVDLLKEFVSKVDTLELVNTFTNAIDAISIINQSNVDLIFLDIEMPHFSGIDFINAIEKIAQTLLKVKIVKIKHIEDCFNDSFIYDGCSILKRA